MPAPFAFITGATALTMKKLPLRLMSIWASPERLGGLFHGERVVDAGVVDKDVDGAEGARYLRRQPLAVGDLGDIRLETARRARRHR